MFVHDERGKRKMLGENDMNANTRTEKGKKYNTSGIHSQSRRSLSFLASQFRQFSIDSTCCYHHRTHTARIRFYSAICFRHMMFICCRVTFADLFVFPFFSFSYSADGEIPCACRSQTLTPAHHEDKHEKGSLSVSNRFA